MENSPECTILLLGFLPPNPFGRSALLIRFALDVCIAVQKYLVGNTVYCQMNELFIIQIEWNCITDLLSFLIISIVLSAWKKVKETTVQIRYIFSREKNVKNWKLSERIETEKHSLTFRLGIFPHFMPWNQVHCLNFGQIFSLMLYIRELLS